MKTRNKRQRTSNEFYNLDNIEGEIYIEEDIEDDEEYEVDEEYNPEDEGHPGQKVDKKTLGILNRIRIEILKSEPNISYILNEPLLIDNKIHLLQLYEIYKSTEINTEGWLELRNKMIELTEQYKNNYTQHNKYSTKEHQEMKNQIDNMNTNQKNGLEYKILQLNTSIENKQVIYRKYKEFNSLSTDDNEYAKLKHWLDWAVSVPYDNVKNFSWNKNNSTHFLYNIKKILDNELHGMRNVKEQILLFISSKIHNPQMKKCSLGLVGPPGVGKTKISRLLATILDFPFEQISFGGVSNADFLKGHDYTYVGAQPGEIIKCLRKMKYKNGIFFFDEYEKISNNTEIISTLLHITDSSQNTHFKDKFLGELSVDLSHIWFIYSMNTAPTDSALRDRIFIIDVPGYDLRDKVRIINKCLLPSALKNIGNAPESIKFNSNSVIHFINKISSEEDKGVRTIEKEINNMVMKIDFLHKHKLEASKFYLSFYLGRPVKYPLTITKSIIDKLI